MAHNQQSPNETRTWASMMEDCHACVKGLDSIYTRLLKLAEQAKQLLARGENVDKILAQMEKLLNMTIPVDDTDRSLTFHMNFMASLKRGELIAFLDHDDLWDERKLDRQVPLFADPGVALAYTGAREVDLVGNVLWEKGGEHFPRGQIFDHLLFNHFITCSTVVIRRSCLDEGSVSG